MKKLITIILVLVFSHVNAADYYFSQASGDDTRTATQAQNPATPWKSLSKAQTVFTTGNRLYFQRGEIWYGNLVAQGSGTSGARIIVSAYGTGAKPIITGFTGITTWTNTTGNIWESTAAASTLSTCNIASINGGNYAKARLPKTGYYTIATTNGSTTITNSNITTSVVSANTGAQMVLRELMYVITANDITNVSGNTATFTSASPAVNWGFFLQNDIKMCTQANEWVYNTATKKISIYSTSTPINIKVPTIETGINCNSKQYITFDNINLVGFNSIGINTTSQTGITIQNCDFNFIGQDGIYAYGNSGNLVVTNCTFSNINSIGIHGGASSNATITNNTLNRIGYFAGMGGNEDLDYTGIICHGDNTNCSYNSLSNIGFNGIYFDGNATNVSYNSINTTNFVKDDGGCIYGFPTQCIPANSPCTQPTRIVSYNTCLNSIGAPEGSIYGSQGAGIYLDGQMANVIVTRNNVGCSNSISTGIYGIFLNGGRYNTIEYNTVYNWKHSFYMQRQTNGGGSFINDTIRNNKFCTPYDNTGLSCTSRKLAAEINFQTASSPTGYYAANNIYANPLDQTRDYIYATFSSGACYSLSAWKSASGSDGGSTASPLVVASLGDCWYITNPTGGSVTTSLGANYIDLDNNLYPGTITVAAYSSAILLKTGTSNTAPTCTAIPSATITLPTNSVSLNGVAASTMGGSIVSWSWVKTSGGAATITNASAQNTTVTGLVQGSYVFTVTATDNNGLTCTATKSVTVNAALVIPTANAGSNQTITLPTNSVTLSGSGSGGTITSYLWSLLSGPCVGCNFSAPTSASTNFTGLIAGIYSVRFRVGNDDGNFGYDTVQITVNPAPVAPTCSAGTTPVTITLPTNTVGLSATGSGVNPVSFFWERTSGPGSVTIASSTSASTTATGLVAGTHVFRVTVTDNVNALTCQSNKTVTVNSAPNIPPVVTVSDNQIITLPTNSVTVSGSAVISSGTLASYLWEYVSGPVTYTITSPATASTTITGLVAGTYRFSLKVTDSNGLIGRDTLIIQVNAAGTEYIPGIRALNASVIQTGVQMMFAVDKPTDMQYFIIQKKTTGSYTNLSSQIKPSLAPIYKYFDANPTTGDSFYRVKALEKNGKTWYSNVVQIKKN